jgi:UDP-glucose 4-epimerase
MNKKASILIIGGFGFLGRNLYKHLIESGYSNVDILSNVRLSPDDPFQEIFQSRLYHGSINSIQVVENAIADHDVIFSFAGISGAASSFTTPFEDVHVNLEGHLNILEACRRKDRDIKVIFPSTRLVYGKPETLPVNESHPLNPQSFYAIHKNTAEYYYQLYSRICPVKTTIFRISNPYGFNFNPEAMGYSILNQFIYKAIKGDVIQIYGDGSQKRDYFHINDLSSLMEEAISNEKLSGQIYNVGSGQPSSLMDVVKIIQKQIPGTAYEQVEWPSLEKKIETGDYYSDISKVTKDASWRPAIDLERGIRITAEAYQK